MHPICNPLDRYQADVSEQWVSTLLTMAKAYVPLLDPRPDLAVPARALKLPYLWWW